VDVEVAQVVLIVVKKVICHVNVRQVAVAVVVVVVEVEEVVINGKINIILIISCKMFCKYNIFQSLFSF
jgi:hypothetical protein